MKRAFLPKREAGFTLVEIMVALFVSALVVAGMFQAFNKIQQWWSDAGARTEQSQNLRGALETLTRDLEMSGYQATNYGDAAKVGLAVTLAEANRIEVDQQRIDIATGIYEPRIVYYHLATDLSTGKKHLYRQIRSEPGLPATDELVAENISAFNLSYFGMGTGLVELDPTTTDPTDTRSLSPNPKDPKNDFPLSGFLPASYTAGTTPPQVLKNIRRIQVSLTAAPTDRTWGTRGSTPTKSLTLTASLAPQNLMISESVGDLTPPAAVTGVQVADTRSCSNKLQVKWTKNPAPDIAGYRIFFGASGMVTIPLAGLADKNNPLVFLKPDDLALAITKNAVRSTSPTIYAIQVAAYDSSGNEGTKSTAVSGNPNPDISTPGATPDTTVNPAKPSKPINMTVTAPTGTTGQLLISWSPPADNSATVGYRLYRSTTAFTSGAHIADAREIANETTLTSMVTSFTDTGLLGCMTYYYAIASVNCDETLVTTYLYNTTASSSDYAAANNNGLTTPLDSTPPPPPNLVGHAGWKRIFLSLDNPTTAESEDFNRTEIWFSKAPAAAPSVNLVTGVVSNGTRIPDRDHTVVVAPETTAVGSFNMRGSQTIIFDSVDPAVPSPPTPQLDELGIYTVLPVSYDRCGNVSTTAAGAYTLILCGDDLVGVMHGAPPNVWGTNPTATSCQLGNIELAWQYPPKYYTGAAAITDFAGYRIFRTDVTRQELTTGPWWTESFTDSGASAAGPVQAGGSYRYELRATDCAYENHRFDTSPPNTFLTDNISLPYYIPSSVPPYIYPGQLEKYVSTANPFPAESYVTTISDPVTPTQYTYHNNVKFHLQNTSKSTMTLKKMAVTWDNPDVVLESITFGGGTSATPVTTVTPGATTMVTQVGAATPVTTSLVNAGSGTIEVASTTGFLPAGQIAFSTTGGAASDILVTYTSTDATHFYGASWARYTAAGGTIARTTTGMPTSTTLTAAVGGRYAPSTPGDTSLPVASTVGFPSAGTVTLDGIIVRYTSVDPTNFLGCTWVGSAFGGGAATSGVPFAVSPALQIRDLATGIGVPSGPIPVRLRFTTPSGIVNRLTDMRSETLTVALWAQNDSLSTANCTTPDEIDIEVPRGPQLGGFSQDAPGDYGVPAYAVIGASNTARDTDLVVPGGTLVNVYGSVFDNSRDISASGLNLGFSQLKLVGTTANPVTDLAVVPLMPAIPSPVASPAFERPLQQLTGSEYAIYRVTPSIAGAKMPLASNQVNWYYVLGVDATGNWDRQPNPDEGNYAYYQPPPPDCSTPKAITNLAINAVAKTRPTLDQATFTWSAVTQYTNGLTIPTSDPIKYDVYSNSSGTAPFTNLVCSDVTGTTCVQNADLMSTANFYVAVAKTTCAPQKVSANSNVVRECLGTNLVFCQTFTVPASANYNSPVTIFINDVCMYANDSAVNSVTFRVKKDTGTGTSSQLANIAVTETTATSGNFTKDLTFKDSGTTAGTNIVSLTSPVYFDLIGGTTTYCSNVPMTLTGATCASIPGPPAPVNAQSPGTQKATVTWTAPTGVTDVLGYEVQYRYRTCNQVRRGQCNNWNNWGSYNTPTFYATPTLTTTYTSLDVGSRGIAQYQFQVRTKDQCSTPNYSNWETSSRLTVRR